MDGWMDGLMRRLGTEPGDEDAMFMKKFRAMDDRRTMWHDIVLGIPRYFYILTSFLSAAFV